MQLLGPGRYPLVGAGAELSRASAAPPSVAPSAPTEIAGDQVSISSVLRLKLRNGCTVALPSDGVFTIGRGERAQVRVEGDLVSRSHCRGEVRQGRLWINDESANGTFVNGKVVGRQQWLAVPPDARLGFGQSACTTSLQEGPSVDSPRDLVNRQGHRFHWPDDADVIKVGRSEDSGLQLSHGQVSNSHALLRRRGEQLLVLDTSSTNGTFVGGQRIDAMRWTEVPGNAELAFGAIEQAWSAPHEA